MRTDRIILHSDMNGFYASVECAERPEIRDKPVVVGGHEELRHGIVLAKNQLAKRYRIKTAEALWQARQKCPDLVVIPPDYKLYMRYSAMARAIYYEYTDLVEPFGLDEAWLDITDSAHLWGGDVERMVCEISNRIKSELGLTVSIGISWNKIFSKFGSDYRKPDGITAITPENYQDIIWPAPVDELLYVGRATRRKLEKWAIHTIGDLACADPDMLARRLGKMGTTLQMFARGEDSTAVKAFVPEKNDVLYEVKTIGNSLTAPRDLADADEIKVLMFLLAESVAQRLREHHAKARTVVVSARDSQLMGYSRQVKLPRPSCITDEIAQTAYDLLARYEPLDGTRPLRSLGVRAADLIDASTPLQLDMFGDEEHRAKLECLDQTIDELRRRFGNKAVHRAASLGDEQLSHLDIKSDNVVYPVSYFHR